MKIFISCATSEFKSCRDAIASDLRAMDAEVKVQEDFRTSGGTLLQKLEAYISQCNTVIVLIGKVFGAAPTDNPSATTGSPGRSYTQWEYFFAMGERLNGSRAAPKHVLPYFASDEYLQQNPPGKTVNDTEDDRKAQLSFINHIRGSGKDRSKFSTVDELRAIVGRDLINLSKVEDRPNNLPFASIGELFTGREKDIEALHDIVDRGSNPTPRTAAITQAARHAISGLGGIGKTRLAVEFARRYSDEFTAILFLTANTPDELSANLGALCDPLVLNLPEHEIQDQKRQYNAVIGWLRMNKDWLLILDNVDTEDAVEAVEDLLTKLPPYGRVLITSRLTNWSAAVSPHTIGLLTLKTSVEFLLDATDGQRPKAQSDPMDVRKLAQILDRLPLALTQAAAYIRVNKVTFVRYIEDWEKAHIEVLGWHNERQMNKYPKALAATWKTTFDQLKPESQDLLYILACYAPDPVPESLLSCEIPAVAGSPAVSDREIRTSLADLHAYSLVEWGDDFSSVSVHRLVQDVTRLSMLPDIGAVALLRAILWLDAACKTEGKRSIISPALGPHAFQLAGAIKPLVDAEAERTRIDPNSESNTDSMASVISAIVDDRDSPFGQFYRGYIVLLAINDDIDRDDLLFGVKGASYQLLHLMEYPHWRNRMMLMTTAIARLGDVRMSETIFCCIFFMVHYWTDCYDTRDDICGPLLRAWLSARPEGSSDDLPGVLKTFLEVYPLFRDYKHRTIPSKLNNWITVKDCIRRVCTILDLTKDLEKAHNLQLFTRGILCMYEAESLAYAPDSEARNEAAVQKLYDQAKAEFNACGDEFHFIWALHDQANSLSENTGKRLQQRAERMCLLGIEKAIKAGEDEDDNVDSEVIADFFVILTAVYTSLGDSGAAWGCTAAAVFCAYMWKDMWEDFGDNYAYTYYGEMVERAMDGLSRRAETDEATAAAAAEFVRIFFTAGAVKPGAGPRTKPYDPDRIQAAILPPIPVRKNVEIDRLKARKTLSATQNRLEKFKSWFPQYPLPPMFPRVLDLLDKVFPE